MVLTAAVPQATIAQTKKTPAIGCVIYKHHATDQFSFPLFLEYTRKEAFPNVINLVTPDGGNERVFSEQTPIFIPYPNDPNGSREDAAAMIGLARQRFPKAAPKLVLIEKAWAAAPPRKVTTPPAVSASPPQKAATALAPITTTDGTTYDAVEITKVNPDSISFTHSAGVATVDFEKLPPDVQRRFHYDPKLAGPSREARKRAAAGAVGTIPSQRIPGQPGLDEPLTPAQIAHNKAIDKKEAAEVVITHDAVKSIMAGFMRDDPPVVPKQVELTSVSPSFSETLAFINDRISSDLPGSDQHVWFGGTSGKLNATFTNWPPRVVQFEAANMSSDVKLITSRARGFTEYIVRLSRATSKPNLKSKHMTGADDHTLKESEQETIQFTLGDVIEQEKVAKAFGHLLHMLGATKDPF